MRKKYLFVLGMLLAVTFAGMGLTQLYALQQETDAGSERLTVVTSFYPMYIAALNVTDGADGVGLYNLSEPQTGCLHDFQLTPEDMKLLGKADVFLINGGGIENFLTRVAQAYPDLVIVEACENTTLLEEDGEENAHAWMSVAAYETQVQTIADALCGIDEENRAQYQENAKVYLEKLDSLKSRQETLKEKIAGSSVILFHEAYAYLADDYGLSVSYVLDLDEERQVSAGEVSAVLQAIREEGVSCILAEERYGKSMGDTVSEETDVQVIYLNSLNRGEYEKDSYLNGMEENLRLLEETFL